MHDEVESVALVTVDLDVYKRQLIGQELDGQSLGLAHSDETGDTTVNAGLLHIDEVEARVMINIRYPVSVSYTHLDVYKRQPKSLIPHQRFSAELLTSPSVEAVLMSKAATTAKASDMPGGKPKRLPMTSGI